MKLRVLNPRSSNPFLVVLRLSLATLFAALILGGVTALALYASFARGLPDIPAFGEFSEKEISTIRAVHHAPIAEFYNEKRYIVSYERLPKSLVNAVLATEDAAFFEHTGLNLKGILRAALLNLRAGRVVGGGSTITQQVAKTFVGNEQSLWRKVKEAILARRLEDRYAKEEILLLYLNRSYLGHNSYGVQAASLNYFRKNVWELSLAESALIAGTFQSPSRRNPWRDYEGAALRATHVLKRMLEVGSLTGPRHELALAELAAGVPVSPRLDSFASGSPFHAAWVRESLDLRHPGWRERGLNVWTPADLWLTRRAERSLAEGLTGLGRRQGFRGPLLRLADDEERARFDRASEAYLRDHPGASGDPVPVRITKVTKKSASFRAGLADLADTKNAAAATADKADRADRDKLGGRVQGELDLKAQAWAAPYTEFPEERFRLELSPSRDRVRVTSIDAAGKEALASAARARSALGRRAVDRAIERLRAGKPQITLSHRIAQEQVSFDGRLKDLRKALAVDDVVLVRWAAPGDGKKKASTPRGSSDWRLVPRPTPQGALLAIDPSTGEVPVILGGVDFDRSQHNRSFSLRQTGSVIKPSLYALAYELGLAPSKVFPGTPYREGTYNPAGAKGDGDMTVWQGLTRSKANISLRVMRFVLDRVGLDELNAWGQALGLTTPFEGYLAEVLGANQTLDSILNPFCTFLRGGLRCPRVPITLVRDKGGDILEDHRIFHGAFNRGRDTLFGFVNLTTERPEQSVRPEIAEIMRANLAQVVKAGTARAVRELGVPAGGKTGTLPFDHWFVGFVDGMLAGVWIGPDKHERFLGREKKRSGLFSAASALPVWRSYASGWLAHRDQPRRALHLLDGLSWPKVHPVSGLLDDEGLTMPHLKGSEPRIRKEEKQLLNFDADMWSL